MKPIPVLGSYQGRLAILGTRANRGELVQQCGSACLVVERGDVGRVAARALSTGGVVGNDSIEQWAGRYLDAIVRGVRSAEVADKIALHLARFRDHVHTAHGHDWLTAAATVPVPARS